MMTALLIAQEIGKDATVLDESITFSKRADDTSGSSTTIRAGESVSLRDAFFGLMLPSGNDASVALAEWYGMRKGAVEAKTDPLKFFVDAMNDEARRLGMMKTTFRNPHGITDPEHKSSCEDLVILANALMQYRFAADVVAPRRHQCVARGQEGYQRRLVWNNSNRLLN